MLNPHFVAGEHGLFGAYEFEDIPTIFICLKYIQLLIFFPKVGIFTFHLQITNWKYSGQEFFEYAWMGFE